MKILVLTDEIFPDAIGGVGKSVHNECVALVRRGHQVTVVVRSLNPTLAPTLLYNGITIHRLKGFPRNHLLYHLYPIGILVTLRRWLRQHPENVDILYCFNPIYILPVRWTSYWRKIPLIHVFYSSMAAEIRINANQGKYGRRKFLASFASRILYQVEKWAFSKASLILPRSQYTLETFKSLFPKVTVKTTLPTGVDITYYKVTPRHEARAKVNLPVERPILITVRRLEGRMGLHSLITAMTEVSRNYPDVLLLITGKGHLRESLENLVVERQLQANVRFLGFVSEEDLPFYLSSADLFVLPTEMLEGFGLATVEALATGVPAMGTPVGATPEILAPIDPKLVTRDSSAESLAETMLYWFNHQDELNALKVRSRAHVEQHYDAAIIAQQLETLFQSLLDKDSTDTPFPS